MNGVERLQQLLRMRGVAMRNPLTTAVAGSAAALLLGAAGMTLWARRRHGRRRARP